MPITPNPESIRQLESLGVHRPIPRIHKPPVPAFHAQHAPAPMRAPVSAVVHAAVPTVPASPIYPLEVFIRWFFGGALITALIGAAVFTMRLAGALAILICCLVVLPTYGQEATIEHSATLVQPTPFIPEQATATLVGFGDGVDAATSSLPKTPADSQDNHRATDNGADEQQAATPVYEPAISYENRPRRTNNVVLTEPQFDLVGSVMVTQLITVALVCYLIINFNTIRKHLNRPVALNSPSRRTELDQHVSGHAAMLVGQRSTDWKPIMPKGLATITANSLPVKPFIVKPKASRSQKMASIETNALPWRSAVHSIQGPVRESNQDYARLVRVGDIEVIAVADGCGGMPHGEVASRCAAEASLEFIETSLSAYKTPSIQMIRDAFAAATESLHATAKEMGFEKFVGDPNRFGLNTTLIMFIATKQRYFFGYIGDGAAHLLRASKEVIELLNPQRVDNCANVLSACLGPIQRGQPIVSELPRYPGDLLLIATDGIADAYAPKILTEAIYERLIARGGNTSATIEEFLEQANSARDNYRTYRFDDNLTCALMLDGRPLQLMARNASSGPLSNEAGEKPPQQISLEKEGNEFRNASLADEVAIQTSDSMSHRENSASN